MNEKQSTSRRGTPRIISIGVPSGMPGGMPFGNLFSLLALARLLAEECPCPECQEERRGKPKSHPERDGDGLFRIVFPLPSYTEVKQLLGLRKKVDYFHDAPIWKEIFAGKIPRFAKISDTGKAWLRRTVFLLKQVPGKFNLDVKAEASLFADLEDATGKSFLLWLTGSKKIKNPDFNDLIVRIKESALDCESDENMVEVREQIELLQGQLPAELRDATEAPQLAVSEDDAILLLTTFNDLKLTPQRVCEILKAAAATGGKA